MYAIMFNDDVLNAYDIFGKEYNLNIYDKKKLEKLKVVNNRNYMDYIMNNTSIAF